MSPELTPSQTVGPFFHDALVDEDRSKLVATSHPSAVRIEGAVYDGAGEPVPDAMVEIWQANAYGRFDDPTDDRENLPLDPETFSGFGRTGTDADGRFSFVTVKPGPVPGPDGNLQAHHVMVSVFARGLLKRLVTRVYFPDEEEANARDPVLSSIGDPAFRKTLVAHDEGDALRFDIHLQGENQTPGPYTLEDLGQDVLALLDGLGVERFSFCGLSIGGMVGMWLASEAPERVERLVLCCTAASFDPDAYSSRARTVRESGVAEVADAVLERWFTPAFREGHPGVLEWAGRMLRDTPPEGYAGCCEAISVADLAGRLGSIRAPTLIIAGAEDPAAPPERSESIRDSVPDARLEILSPAAHLANVESPEAMTGAILDHLQAAPGEGI